jgi:hypothetical protein
MAKFVRLGRSNASRRDGRGYRNIGKRLRLLAQDIITCTQAPLIMVKHPRPQPQFVQSTHFNFPSRGSPLAARCMAAVINPPSSRSHPCRCLRPRALCSCPSIFTSVPSPRPRSRPGPRPRPAPPRPADAFPVPTPPSASTCISLPLSRPSIFRLAAWSRFASPLPRSPHPCPSPATPAPPRPRSAASFTAPTPPPACTPPPATSLPLFCIPFPVMPRPAAADPSAPPPLPEPPRTCPGPTA